MVGECSCCTNRGRKASLGYNGSRRSKCGSSWGRGRCWYFRIGITKMSSSSRSLALPNELKSFLEPSCLLPGENRHDFETIRQMMIDEIQPETNIEWLWLLDLVELSWEILRYRKLKQRILQMFRA